MNHCFKSFKSWRWKYLKFFVQYVLTLILLIELIDPCNPDILAKEKLTESPKSWLSNRVYRLFVNRTQSESIVNPIRLNTTKVPIQLEVFGLEKSGLETGLEKSGLETGLEKSGKSSESLEKLFDHFDSEEFSNEITFPSKRTGINPFWNKNPTPAGSENLSGSENFKSKTPFKKPERLRPQPILPASHIDASHGQPSTRIKPYKAKIQKRRKQQMQEPLHLYPPFSSIKSSIKNKRFPSYSNMKSKNVSLKATFLRPETEEETSSIELELSVNGKSNENQDTKIQIANPNPCVRISETREKRTFLNVWTYSNGKLKLESQREIPGSIFNGSRGVDGELLNRGEIPRSVASELSSLLNGIGRSDNRSVFTNFHLPVSAENLFGGNRRPNVIMLHYILWGQQEKAWRQMLDRTVENYLRNYFLSTFGRRHSRIQKPVNWRAMRNVLLSFMASPDNCTKRQESLEKINPGEEYILKRPIHQGIPGGARPNSRHPLRQNPMNAHFPASLPITRDDTPNYGWQQNGWGVQQLQQGWGVQQHQQGWGQQPQQGWGVQEVNQGWGWGDEGGKKKKGKKKKKKKKGKKKKGKKKKKKKKNSGWGDRPGWGEPPGWGWGQAVMPQMDIGWGPIKWNSIEFNPGEIANRILALIGLTGLPIALFVATGVVVYLISSKNKNDGPIIQSTYHQPSPPAIMPQVIMGGYPRLGWRRRTERPYDPYNGVIYSLGSTLSPYGWNDQHLDYRGYPRATYVPKKNMSTYNGTQNGANGSNGFGSNVFGSNGFGSNGSNGYKMVPMTFADIKQSGSFRYNKISDTYPRIRNQGDRLSSQREYDKHYYKQDPYYDADYAANKLYAYTAPFSVANKTKQEEDLIKILSKHKKSHVEKLLQKWKLDKLKKS